MNGSQVVYGSSTPLVVPLKTNGQRKFHPKTLRAFSVINILLGLISCVLMTAVIVPFNGGFSFSGNGSIDVVGHGLWAGVFYLITGFLGYSASYKATNGLMVSTLVFSVFSILSAITASVLSGIMGGEVWWYRPCYYYLDYIHNTYTCEVWISLEYSLLGFSVLAWIANIVVLSVTSATVCCSKKPPKNQMPYYVVQNVPNANPIVGANGLWNNNNQFTSTPPAVSVLPSDQPLQISQQQLLQQQQLFQQQFLQQHLLQQQQLPQELPQQSITQSVLAPQEEQNPPAPSKSEK